MRLLYAHHVSLVLTVAGLDNEYCEILLCYISYKCSAVAEMGNRLVTIDMDRKLGCCALLGAELGPHLTQCGQSRRLPASLNAKFHLDQPNRLATIHQRYIQTDRQISMYTLTLIHAINVYFLFAWCRAACAVVQTSLQLTDLFRYLKFHLRGRL